jgi:hypothetical protein
MTRSPIFAIMCLSLVITRAEAVRFCKDGFVTYPAGVLSLNRGTAEASAVRAWRAAGATIGLSRTNSIPRSDQMQCSRSEDKKQWRCFVRGGHCKSV